MVEWDFASQHQSSREPGARSHEPLNIAFNLRVLPSNRSKSV